MRHGYGTYHNGRSCSRTTVQIAEHALMLACGFVVLYHADWLSSHISSMTAAAVFAASLTQSSDLPIETFLADPSEQRFLPYLDARPLQIIRDHPKLVIWGAVVHMCVCIIAFLGQGELSYYIIQVQADDFIAEKRRSWKSTVDFPETLI